MSMNQHAQTYAGRVQKNILLVVMLIIIFMLTTQRVSAQTPGSSVSTAVSTTATTASTSSSSSTTSTTARASSTTTSRSVQSSTTRTQSGVQSSSTTSTSDSSTTSTTNDEVTTTLPALLVPGTGTTTTKVEKPTSTKSDGLSPDEKLRYIIIGLLVLAFLFLLLTVFYWKKTKPEPVVVEVKPEADVKDSVKDSVKDEDIIDADKTQAIPVLDQVDAETTTGDTQDKNVIVEKSSESDAASGSAKEIVEKVVEAKVPDPVSNSGTVNPNEALAAFDLLLNTVGESSSDVSQNDNEKEMVTPEVSVGDVELSESVTSAENTIKDPDSSNESLIHEETQQIEVVSLTDGKQSNLQEDNDVVSEQASQLPLASSSFLTREDLENNS